MFCPPQTNVRPAITNRSQATTRNRVFRVEFCRGIHEHGANLQGAIYRYCLPGRQLAAMSQLLISQQTGKVPASYWCWQHAPEVPVVSLENQVGTVTIRVPHRC